MNPSQSHGMEGPILCSVAFHTRPSFPPFDLLKHGLGEHTVKAFSEDRRMRAILLSLVTCLLVSCVSSTRARETHCLGATMMDAWQAEDDFKSAERAWRTAQQVRFERSPTRQDSLLQSLLVSKDSPSSITVTSASVRVDNSSDRLSEVDEERALYRQVVAAQARHLEMTEWYGRVARRVQTRVEEDDMLNPVLGTLVTSTAIVFYPIIRWNVRSVLWDGVDPDAPDDPVQVYCASRLERERSGLHP
jgi:hypothetical protein